MATKARRATDARSSSRRKKKGRGVLWMIAGLLVGVALMYGAQHLVYRDSKPFRGFAGLVDSGTKAIGRGNEPKSEPPAERPQKPKLDFYTILPEYETVLPEPKPAKKTARPEPAETDVRYADRLRHAHDRKGRRAVQARRVLRPRA